MAENVRTVQNNDSHLDIGNFLADLNAKHMVLLLF